ncbi:MAG: aspartate aminotransferase family protein, partial [Candidatus Hodarchaeota archaeon]
QVPFGDIDALRRVIDGKTACVIFEPIPATGGILIPPEGYFATVRELCDEKGVQMIADEVQTGLGRTGVLWGIYGGLYPNEKVVPDLLVLGKGMSSGVYPLATVSYKPSIEEIFAEDPFLHISSTGGSELGCYVARKMLEITSQPSFLAHVQKMGNLFGERLGFIKEKLTDLIVDIRGRGLMWGIEFPSERLSLGFMLAMIKNGVFIDYCGNKTDTVKFLPPLIVQIEDINEILNRLDKAFKELVSMN